MENEVKIYKPSKEEILHNVIGSFEIENIKVTYIKARETLDKVLVHIKKAKR